MNLAESPSVIGAKRDKYRTSARQPLPPTRASWEKSALEALAEAAGWPEWALTAPHVAKLKNFATARVGRRHPLMGASRASNCAAPGKVKNLSLIHISEPTRLGMISYAVFCLKK